MIITIHQPEHLPWMGLLNKIAKAEKFIILDNVQFEKNHFQNRNKILGTNGVQWIGIPVVNTKHMEGTIATTLIASDPKNIKWREKYIQTIKQSYGKYPYFESVYPIIENAINMDTIYFCDINIKIIKAFCDALKIYPEYIKASDLQLDGRKSDLILDICKKTNASTYISGPFGKEYLNIEEFNKANINVVYNDYVHPTYEQRRTNEFVSHLSAIDLFMNVGFDKAREIIIGKQ